MNTAVIIGSSVYRDYSFVVPITALLWRDYIGFEPHIYLVGSEEEWLSVGSKEGNPYPNATRTVVEALRKHGIRHTFVPRFGGFSDGTIAQNLRQHAAADRAFPDDQWMMPGDADLWPLRPEFYRQHEGRDDLLAVSYYANGDHFQGRAETLKKWESGLPFQSIPTCHVAMRAKEWRVAYGIESGDDIAAAVTRSLTGEWKKFVDRYAGPDVNLARWCCDQWYMTERLCRQEWFSDRVGLVPRHGHPPVDRLDRGLGVAGYWTQSFDRERWVDAHVHKQPEEAERWATLLPIVKALIPEYVEWAKRYREEYVNESAHV